jgi:hypothetical protein
MIIVKNGFINEKLIENHFNFYVKIIYIKKFIYFIFNPKWVVIFPMSSKKINNSILEYRNSVHGTHFLSEVISILGGKDSS